MKTKHMTLPEALEVLGPARVRKGMRAIDKPRDFEEYGKCATCFVGEAFGGTQEGYSKAKEGFYYALPDRQSPQMKAVSVVEGAYENWGTCSRADLREACIVHLAEHGETQPSGLLSRSTPLSSSTPPGGSHSVPRAMAVL